MHKKVLAHLDKYKVRYTHVPHKTVYTAYDLANTLKKKLNEIAKTLVVKVDKRYVLVVLPANVRVDLQKVKKVLKAESVHLLPEGVMEKIWVFARRGGFVGQGASKNKRGDCKRGKLYRRGAHESERFAQIGEGNIGRCERYNDCQIEESGTESG
ncbi:MAG: YbaK/prolyl-tRNA synthetase associated region [Candidatus Magasanikbacteria bacterium GW2011_GWC2_45_8]|uniref:YbaK/prolyl-tRNA synthetase associated region n=1 Tax=Candidatus Magasanikbacteria bacterium GW2011_GWC2_45_8 TaxID=1619050 RepID=A0A0G1Q7M9_9BACT|nr:MAG: YbaK/prolyl-tRNA synthetase associated region [Candidatus Magasanikbacteria bacterium GW2011_GWC2_45_8]